MSEIVLVIEYFSQADPKHVQLRALTYGGELANFQICLVRVHIE